MQEALNININRCISKAFIEYGYEMPISEKEVFFSPLKIWITGKLDHREDSLKGNIHARLIIKTRHEGLFPDGIFEFAYGGGTDMESAIIDAAYRWIQSDFNTIHDLLCTAKEHNHDGNKADVVSMTPQGEVLGWEIVFGPLISTTIEGVKQKISQDEIFWRLFDVITEDLLGEKGIYPIKFFAIQNEKNEIDADCRLNGQDWQKGREALLEYIREWNLKDIFHWRKQYVIVVNRPIEHLHNGQELLKELQERQKNTSK